MKVRERLWHKQIIFPHFHLSLKKANPKVECVTYSVTLPTSLLSLWGGALGLGIGT